MIIESCLVLVCPVLTDYSKTSCLIFKREDGLYQLPKMVLSSKDLSTYHLSGDLLQELTGLTAYNLISDGWINLVQLNTYDYVDRQYNSERILSVVYGAIIPEFKKNDKTNENYSWLTINELYEQSNNFYLDYFQILKNSLIKLGQ